jgi:phosphoribosylformylglycinamidine synthase
VALALGTPFISGKDSLNNEFRPAGQEPISIPPSLLISALGQLDHVSRSVTMDLKEAGNYVYLVGLTKNELAGSHFALVEGLEGGEVPKVDPAMAKRTFAAVHNAIRCGRVRACHDLSEGGLAVAAAEMAFAGGLGLDIDVRRVPCSPDASDPAVLLFSESNTRFLCEVPPRYAEAFETTFSGPEPSTQVPCRRIGTVIEIPHFQVRAESALIVNANLKSLKEAWQKPLRW